MFSLSQALERDKFADKFRQMTGEIEVSLNNIPYDKLNLSEEVQEQVPL